MNDIKTLAALALAATSAACASSDNLQGFARDAMSAPGAAYAAAHRAAAPPSLSPIGTPAPLTGGEQATMPQPAVQLSGPTNAASLWQTGSRSFFNDQRASRIGDILTVQIEIADKAEISNSSSRHRTSATTSGVNNFFGIQSSLGHLFGGGFDPGALIDANADSAATGTGAINREEKVRLTVAAVIVDRLPNGNLVIAGRQEVRINSELRELTVSGVVRPEDIAADNTIRHDQIAEARISYGGRGQISAVQRPNLGQRVGDAISPF